MLNLCWVSIAFDIFIANIPWTVAQTPINHIIFWKTVIRTLRYIYVNYFNRLRFLAEVSTRLQKMHFFGQFKDHNSGRNNGNCTNDPIFSSTFSPLLYQNQPPIFCCPLFFENYLNPQAMINKMVNKHTVNYHPSPSQLVSRIHTLIFLWTPKGFISPESFLNFFLNLYIPPWLRKSFKIIVLRLLQIHLWVKKLNLFIFIHVPKQNSPPGSYNYPPGRREWPISPERRFLKIFFLRRKGGEDYGVGKKIPTSTKVLVTCFVKLHHLCKLYIFGVCFAVQ